MPGKELAKARQICEIVKKKNHEGLLFTDLNLHNFGYKNGTDDEVVLHDKNQRPIVFLKDGATMELGYGDVYVRQGNRVALMNPEKNVQGQHEYTTTSTSNGRVYLADKASVPLKDGVWVTVQTKLRTGQEAPTEASNVGLLGDFMNGIADSYDKERSSEEYKDYFLLKMLGELLKEPTVGADADFATQWLNPDHRRLAQYCATKCGARNSFGSWVSFVKDEGKDIVTLFKECVKNNATKDQSDAISVCLERGAKGAGLDPLQKKFLDPIHGPALSKAFVEVDRQLRHYSKPTAMEFLFKNKEREHKLDIAKRIFDKIRDCDPQCINSGDAKYINVAQLQQNLEHNAPQPKRSWFQRFMDYMTKKPQEPVTQKAVELPPQHHIINSADSALLEVGAEDKNNLKPHLTEKKDVSEKKDTVAVNNNVTPVQTVKEVPKERNVASEVPSVHM